ncbi:MAG: phytanoyl-CoA dioxygenase family protein [Candidatus Latescibacterota bacterium]|nr:phytanoyl-CoA dioxygenase family protein [Candidatus Latescibacterota bacterium]
MRTELRDQLRSYQRTGYLVVPNGLSEDEVAVINAAIDRDIATDSPFWTERENGHVTLSVHMLLAYEEMDVTMRSPALMPILEAILGARLCAEEHSVRIRRPFDGEPYCHWHRDGSGWPDLLRDAPEYTAYVSVVYYLSDVDNTTHTFSVLPGSGQGRELPELDRYNLSEAHHIEGVAGTAVIFNAGMFHAGNVRRSCHERRTIHIYCGRRSALPISNYTIFPRRLTEHEDDATRAYYRRPNAITRLRQAAY